MLLNRQGGNETRLYTETTYGKYLLLHIGETQVRDFGFEDRVTTYNIQPATGSNSDANLQHGEEGFDAPADATRNYTADWVTKDDSFVVVVRPDMYIGCVSQNMDEAKAYLANLYVA
jgi:hypothetical protein